MDGIRQRPSVDVQPQTREALISMMKKICKSMSMETLVANRMIKIVASSLDVTCAPGHGPSMIPINGPPLKPSADVRHQITPMALPTTPAQTPS